MNVHIANRQRRDGGSEYEAERGKKICNLSTQKFAAIVDSAAFVDKTLFIKDFLEAEESVIAICAPRKFGKSTNMDMLKTFFSGNRIPFENKKLKIYEEERHLFKYYRKDPVIHVDFKNVGGKTGDEILETLKIVIQGAYEDHNYLKNYIGDSDWKSLTLEKFVQYWKNPASLSRADVIVALKYLSECVHKQSSNPVYVLIDNYDAPIKSAIMNTNLENGVVEETINLISYTMSYLFHDNKHVQKGLINACVPLGTMLSCDLDNIRYCEFLEPKFAPYFGFTDREVRALFERDEFASLNDDYEIEKWYGGYRLTHTNEDVIYNSYSILEYLQKSREMNKPQFNTYWVDKVGIPNLTELFAKAEIRKLIEILINDEEVEITTIRKMYKDEICALKSLIQLQHDVVDRNHIYLFLYYLALNGYLNVVKTTVSTHFRTTTLSLPNQEIKKLFKEKCYHASFFEKKYNLCPAKITDYLNALLSLLQQRHGADSRFAKAVSELFNGSLKLNNEYELHNILISLAYSFRLYGLELESQLSVQRIKRRGKPYNSDILLVLDDVGMIIEVKFNGGKRLSIHRKMVEEGYLTAFNDYRNVAVKILVALNVHHTGHVELAYTVNDSDVEIANSVSSSC